LKVAIGAFEAMAEAAMIQSGREVVGIEMD
jgi:hypothetical protein